MSLEILSHLNALAFSYKRQYKGGLMHYKDLNRHMKLSLAFFWRKQQSKKLFKKIKQVSFKQSLLRILEKFYFIITAL